MNERFLWTFTNLETITFKIEEKNYFELYRTENARKSLGFGNEAIRNVLICVSVYITSFRAYTGRIWSFLRAPFSQKELSNHDNDLHKKRDMYIYPSIPQICNYVYKLNGSLFSCLLSNNNLYKTETFLLCLYIISVILTKKLINRKV